MTVSPCRDVTPAFGGGPTGTAITFKPWTQTISTSLVYRFNWGGAPISAAGTDLC